MRYMILCLLMRLVVMHPVSADDATLTQCDFNAFASAMNTLQIKFIKNSWGIFASDTVIGYAGNGMIYSERCTECLIK